MDFGFLLFTPSVGVHCVLAHLGAEKRAIWDYSWYRFLYEERMGKFALKTMEKLKQAAMTWVCRRPLKAASWHFTGRSIKQTIYET
jgi:hypothetical protein